MADFDLRFDTTPLNNNAHAKGTSIAALKAALTTFNSTSYTPARLQTMTKLDLRYAARLHGLTVNGL